MSQNEQERTGLLRVSNPEHNGANGGGIFTSSTSGSIGAGSITSRHNDYSTFFQQDSSVRSLLRTSDNIERARRTVVASEELAKNVLVDLELQRSQLHDTKEKVSETSNMTRQVRRLLQLVAERSYRKKLCLIMVIVALSITDLLVFYILFVR